MYVCVCVFMCVCVCVYGWGMRGELFLCFLFWMGVFLFLCPLFGGFFFLYKVGMFLSLGTKCG